MIAVILDQTELNDYPTPRAVAYALEGEPELWRYAFLDKERMRWISWAVIEREIERISALKRRVNDGKRTAHFNNSN